MPSPSGTSLSAKLPQHVDGSLKRRISDENSHASQRDLRHLLSGDCAVCATKKEMI